MTRAGTLGGMRLLPALAALALVGACSSDPDPEPETAPDPTPTASASSSPAEPSPSEASSSPSEPAEPAGPTLAVTVEGEQVTPNAEELTATVGEPITITFTADRAGELHVHAKPEQYVEFTEGTTTAELVIDVPGSVEIEEHETGAVVAQVEVRP